VVLRAGGDETAPPIGVDERIEFAPGADGATIEDGVVSGTTNRYHLRAAAGQSMAIVVESLEANAVFSVFAPDGTLISNPGVTTFAGTLPTTGDYLVEVATVRGNATYRMDVQIVGPFPVTPSPVGVERRVEFEPGTDHGLVEGAIVLGTADRFVLRASAGQSMSISVVSLEDNAVVRVYGTEGELPGGGGDSFAGTLPADGDYVVEVSSTRGNATYAAIIQITGRTGQDEVGGLVERIEFAPGTNGASVDGAVVVGNVDQYVLGASAGQTMGVHLDSDADNATFVVTAPDDTWLAFGPQDATVYLPADGDYVIAVTVTAGEQATYAMTVWID
jgi:hypothetical protein